MRKLIRIAITPRHIEFNNNSFSRIDRKYVKYWHSYGYELCLIPFTDDVDVGSFLDDLKIKGVLLAGGYNYYSEEIRKFEHKIISAALKIKLPVFGVCCGMWSINGYFGGKLGFCKRHYLSKYNLKFIVPYILSRLVGKKFSPNHKIKLVGNLIGGGEYKVNTHHRKCIDKLGKDIVPFANAPDGIIEGIFHKNKKIVGVQFHFERRNCDKAFEKKYMAYVRKLVG